MLPENLTNQTPDDLYQALDDLTAHRRAYGRGRSPEAAYVKEYCKAERARVKAELKRRGLRLTRPGDDRVYGPGQATWQRAGGARDEALPVQFPRGRSRLFKTEATR